MGTPPTRSDDDDPAGDWRDDQATEVELLPEDLSEVEREEPTPTAPPSLSTLDYERGRRAGVKEERDRVLAAVGAILSASHSVSTGEVAGFIDLVRQKLDHPGGR